MTESNITVIGGLGASGSSALCDLLKEVNGYYVMPEEFRLFTDPDGLFSLKSALVDNWTVYQSDIAISRFKKLVNLLNNKYSSPYYYISHDKIFGYSIYQFLEEYINSIMNFKYKGLWLGRRNYFNIFLSKLFHKTKWKDNVEYNDIYLSKILTNEEFYKCTREFINNLVEFCLNKSDKTKFVFDEGFISMNPVNLAKFIPDVKIVVVIRDPRGIYTEAKKWSFIPSDLDEFIAWQRALLARWNHHKSKLSSNTILEIEFDNLVLDYDDTVNTIFQFLGINPSSHMLKGQYFIPLISKRNVLNWQTKLPSRVSREIYERLFDVYEPYRKSN